VNSSGGIDGLHLMANLHGCAAAESLLRDADLLRSMCIDLVMATGLGAVGECFHQFGNGGVTGVVMLAESHLSLHTWPEKHFVTLDVFVCNLQCDNRAKARELFASLVKLFEPADEHFYEVERA
jgi:S-adenosylmethionine decarboxylase